MTVAIFLTWLTPEFGVEMKAEWIGTDGFLKFLTA
jgi:hypothetical protein